MDDFFRMLYEAADEATISKERGLSGSFAFTLHGQDGEAVEISAFTMDGPGKFSFLGRYTPPEEGGA